MSRFLRRAKADARVEGEDAARQREERVNVHLLDLRVVLGELCNEAKGSLERRAIGRRVPTNALEQGTPADCGQHVASTEIARWGDAEHDVAKSLHEDAAEAEHYEWPEKWLTRNPDDRLRPTPGHALNEHTIDPSAHVCARDALEDVPIRVLQLALAIDADANTADVGFVADVA